MWVHIIDLLRKSPNYPSNLIHVSFQMQFHKIVCMTPKKKSSMPVFLKCSYYLLSRVVNYSYWVQNKLPPSPTPTYKVFRHESAKRKCVVELTSLRFCWGKKEKMGPKTT